MSFSELGLSSELMRAVAEQGYETATPIQEKAIPVVLSGRDVMAKAQTGTGKTAAFTLPLLHLLSKRASRSTSPAMHPVRALILTPTRELAVQVGDSVSKYGKYLPLRSLVVYGGVHIGTQLKALQQGVDILVATPGRLMDHVEQKSVRLSQVEIIVLDEADRMLDMGFIQDIVKILGFLPKKRQGLLFSATFSPEIKKLADSLLNDPVTIETTPRNSAAETVVQSFFRVDSIHKREALVHLLKARALPQVLVFTRTKQMAGRLALQLEKEGIAAAAIHGDKAQSERTKSLEDFKSGAVHVLVATDVAARGLDIDQLPAVINFELPHSAPDYIHRIGRTGRAGASGEAISLVAPEERKSFDDIAKLLKRTIELNELDIQFAPRSDRTGGRGLRDAAPRERHSRAEGERPTRSEQPTRERSSSARKKEPDIFDMPYVPQGDAATKPAIPHAPKPRAGKRREPLAALLGGIPHPDRQSNK